ncbi:MAG: hypothetical protein ABW184_12785 [Sphingobium sp.]
MATFKRKVHYLGGFDPRGARFYHGLCEEQIGKLTGADAATVGKRRRVGGDMQWEIWGDVQGDDAAFLTNYEFLVWDDLVRRHWVKGGWGLIGHMVTAYRHFIAQIDWKAARPVPAGSKLTLFYPGASVLLLPLLIALPIWIILAQLVGAIFAGIPALAIGVWATPAVLKRLHSLWLLRFIIFNDMLARGATDPALGGRLDHFVDRIDASLAEDWDEILFVVHSNGSILAVPIMAALLDRHGGKLPDHFNFVTLGSTIQLVSLRRDASRFHALCDTLAQGWFRWLDIGSPTDGACIPLVDPFPKRPVSRPVGLLQFSPRWFRYCDPATYKARRRNKYETHFDYLRRLDSPSPLDFVSIVCGAQPLGKSIAAFEAQNGETRHV